MLRTALRNVLAHKARLIMTALAVLLGVAFVSGTLVFSSTVGEAFKDQSAKSFKDVAVSVTADYDEREDGNRSSALDSALTEEIRALPGVASVRPSVTGSATIAGKDGEPLTDQMSWPVATNYVPDKDGEDPRYPVTKGRGPAASDEIALAAKTADKGGYQVGDTVRLATDGPAMTKKLVGIVDTEDPRILSDSGSLTLFDTPTAQKLFLSPGQYDELVVSAKPGVDPRALTSKVRELLPKEGVEADSGPELAAEQARQIAEDNRYLANTLLVFAGIALFVGVFIIANTFTMLIAQRSREIALLRAVGASRRQVVRSVLAEAALLGLACSVTGFVVGIGIAVGMRAVLNANDAGFPDGPLVIGADAVVAALAVGVLVTVLAAWLPSRKAAKIAPVEAMSSVDAAPRTRGLRIRNTVGALLTAAGVTVMLYVSTLEGDEGLPPAMLGAALTMAGLIVLAPLLSRPLVSLAGQVTSRLFGVTGKLAKENALRNPRRTAATASALMIGLTLITGLAVAGYSTQVGLDEMATKGMTADYKVSQTNWELPDDSTGKIAQVPGVAAAAPLTSAGYDADGGFGILTGTDPATLNDTVDLAFSSGSIADIGTGRIAVSEQTAQKNGWQAGDVIQLDFWGDEPGERQTEDMTVVGVYEDNSLIGDALGTIKDVAPHAHRPDTLESVLVKAESGDAAGGLDKDIRSALGNSPLLEIQDRDEIQESDAGAITVVLNLVYGLLGMAVIIAVLGVINTLAMSVFERTREIGMLRAIGLDRGGIRRMVRLESVVICLFGAVLGMATGVFLAWAAGSLVGSSFPTYETLLPWDRLGLFLLIALAVGVLAAIWPARRAARLNMLRSINAQ